MKKILLMILVPSVFIWADMNQNEERVLQDIKTPYTIQDETSEISTEMDSELFSHETTQIPTDDTDDELLPMEGIFDSPDEDPKEEMKRANKIGEEKPVIPMVTQKEHLTEKKRPKKAKESNKSQKSKEALEIERIRKELDIKEPSARTLRIDSIREDLKIGYKKPVNESTLDRRLDDINEGLDALSIDNIKSKIGFGGKKKKDTGFFLTDTLSDFGDTIGMDIGIPGMPDFLGFGGSKKKKDSGILDSVMGFGFLGDIKDTGTSMYKGAKYSGQSAEMMSGMMYNSSKMYNNMFGMFDDSPFNVFEEEEEASMFDVFEHGNTVMDMFN
jgi:hypothetical protein